jgi:hypothetical protein
MTTGATTDSNSITRAVSATLTILTKSRRAYDSHERWTAQKIKDELLLDLSNAVSGNVVYNPALYPNGVSEEIQGKYRQGARKLLYRIPIDKPAPYYITYLSNLDRSFYVVFPHQFASELKISKGDYLTWELVGDSLVVRKAIFNEVEKF